MVFYITCFVLELASAGIASAEMLAQFNFNRDSTTTVRNESIKGHDGTYEVHDRLLIVNFSTGLFTISNGWIGSVAEMLKYKPLSCV